MERSRLVKQLATELGFCRAGITAAAPIGRIDYLTGWLEGGRAGSMEYLKRNQAIRADPSRILEGARSVIVAAMSYHAPPPPRLATGWKPVAHDTGHHGDSQASWKPVPHGTGRVARYAWGNDYHWVVRQRLERLLEGMRGSIAEPFQARICVDTAPLLERELAAAAGVGWIGKNTMVLHQDVGSYFFLGEVVTTLDLATDEPATDHCGSCTRCLEACPTRAFPAAYEMDASRCISYLTIEHRDAIPEAFHAAMGDWIYGCDVCQEVCPYNHEAPTTDEPEFQIRTPGPFPAIDELLAWTSRDYAEQLRGSAMKRAKLEMLKRNAQIAFTNNGGASVDTS